MKITASVDRFEGDWAILIIDEKHKIDFPCELLPKGVAPGSWIDLTIKENKGRKLEVSQNVKSLLEELKEGKHLD